MTIKQLKKKAGADSENRGDQQIKVEVIKMEDEIRRINQKLKKIKGNDPISRARKAALLLALCALMAEAE